MSHTFSHIAMTLDVEMMSVEVIFLSIMVHRKINRKIKQREPHLQPHRRRHDAGCVFRWTTGSETPGTDQDVTEKCFDNCWRHAQWSSDDGPSVPADEPGKGLRWLSKAQLAREGLSSVMRKVAALIDKPQPPADAGQQKLSFGKRK